jgi:alpha-tubulin suppressor-like RCC1 family protein
MGGGPVYTTTCGIEVGGQVDCWGHVPLKLTPTPVAGDLGFDAVYPATNTICGTAAGALYCWSRSTVPAPLTAGHSVVSVTMGWSHTCVVTIEHETWCGGTNSSGELGNGSNPVGWLVPVPVWAPGG